MLNSSLFTALLLLAFTAQAATPEATRWQQHAQATTITRDDWGIAHVRGKTDADAVFGMVYAQAEDDFHRIEVNYLTALGRMAEANGESAIWQDLRQRLFIDPAVLQDKYRQCPLWLQRLMVAWADGLNAYLNSHPDVHPMVLAHFEPWMALSFTEGSIGGDIERVDLKQLAAFYGESHPALAAAEPASWTEPTGSNGIAIAPQAYRGRPRAAADQSAHLVLFSLRAADVLRGGFERLRRGDVGAVFRLSGL